MASDKGIRISEVARNAGVPVSTVKFYLREDLLPEPVYKNRNSAYYSDETVERVKLIRDLREKAFLPLKVISEILERTTDADEIRKYLGPGPADSVVLGATEEWVPIAEFLGDGGFTEDDLERLRKIRMLEPHLVDGVPMVGRLDAALLKVLSRMRGLGLTSERGFKVDHVAIYREPLEKLARQEITLALERLVGSMPPAEVGEAAAAIMESAAELVSIIHRKVVAEVIAEIGGGKVRSKEQK
jgi:DNA-binding transcriptional MerR regulator